MALPNQFVAVDTETTGLDLWGGDHMIAASAVFPNGQTMFWRDEYSSLKKVLEDSRTDKIFHNAPFDLNVLQHEGFIIKGKVWDTSVLGHIVDGRQLVALERMAERYLPPHRRKVVDELNKWFDEHGISKKQRGKHFTFLPPDLLEKRCISDATLTLLLFVRLLPTCQQVFPMILELENSLIPIIAKMQDRGIMIDQDEILRQEEHFTDIIEEVTEWAECLLGREGVDPCLKSDQLDMLAAAGLMSGLHHKTPKKREPQINALELQAMHHPVAYHLLNVVLARNFRDTFCAQIRHWERNNVIHPGFNQNGTVTGRISCSKPNLLNLPVEAERPTNYTLEDADESIEYTGIIMHQHTRGIFICRPGFCHVHSDKKRIELVMLAHYSGEKKMAEALASTDPHAVLSMELFGVADKAMKRRTKRAVFGWAYGMGAKTMGEVIGDTEAAGKDILLRLHQRLPGLPRWQRKIIDEIIEKGYVQTIHGRRHYLMNSESYMAVNRLCQGTAADEVKTRMVALESYFKKHAPECTILLNIYDDLGIEVPIPALRDVLPDIRRIMHETSTPYSLPVPASMEVTFTRWSDAKEIEFNAKNKPIKLVIPNTRHRSIKSKSGVGKT